MGGLLLVAVHPHAGCADQPCVGAEGSRDQPHLLVWHQATRGPDGLVDRILEQVQAAHQAATQGDHVRHEERNQVGKPQAQGAAG